MSQYENFHDEDHVFYDMTVKEVQSKIQNKETLTVYFGFAKCPSCNEAMPVLNETAKEYHDTVLPAMAALRAPIDELETIVDSEYWPVPTYGELMFEV